MNVKRWAAVFGLLALLMAAAGCGGRDSQQEDNGGLNITLEAASLDVGPTTLVISVADADGAPVNDAVLSVRGDMTHAGMLPVLGDAVSDGAAGRYLAPFEWTMGGDWVVTVEVTLADGTVARESFDLTING